MVAPAADLIAAFGTDDIKAIAPMVSTENENATSIFLLVFIVIVMFAPFQMLEKGELQVSDKERKNAQEMQFKDIACIVAEKCINSETKRPFPVGLIEQALKDMHFSIHPSKSAKQQALEVIRELEKVIPIQRASMRLRVTLPQKIAKAVKTKMQPLWQVLEDEQFGNPCELVNLNRDSLFSHPA
jgi:ribosome maturation protein Sdo1